MAPRTISKLLKPHDKAVVALGALLQAVGDGLLAINSSRRLSAAIVTSAISMAAPSLDINADVGGGQGGEVDAVAQHDDLRPAASPARRWPLSSGRTFGVIRLHADSASGNVIDAVRSLSPVSHDGFLRMPRPRSCFQNLDQLLFAQRSA